MKDTGSTALRPTRRPYSDGELAAGGPAVDLYALAVNTVTALQRRVLSALDREPRDLLEVYTRTGRVTRGGAGRLGFETSYPVDLITTRNVLGWLTWKGLALCDQDGPLTWRRA